VDGRPYLVEFFPELGVVLGEHPLDRPADVGNGGIVLVQTGRAHRDDEFPGFAVALDSNFDFDCLPRDRRVPD
jgi:hypothetical protein